MYDSAVHCLSSVSIGSIASSVSSVGSVSSESSEAGPSAIGFKDSDCLRIYLGKCPPPLLEKKATLSIYTSYIPLLPFKVFGQDDLLLEAFAYTSPLPVTQLANGSCDLCLCALPLEKVLISKGCQHYCDTSFCR